MINAKYKGLRIDGEGWIYGYLVDWRSVNGDCEIMDLSHAYDVFPESVGQFTGLKDANGTEIYGGDILIDNTLDKESFCVEWDLGGFKARFLNSEKYTQCLSTVLGNFIVIKNIAE